MRKHDYALFNFETGTLTIVTSLVGKKKGDTVTVTVPVLNYLMIKQAKLTDEQIDEYLEAHPELEQREFTIQIDSDVTPYN